LQRVAEVAKERGLTRRLVSEETVRTALRRMKVRWKRARHWITSPDPQYVRKKRRVSDCYDWPTGTRTGYWVMQMK
jgi:hypothetical protein